ncbi:MAG: metallophosphoesterase family protein [Chloroflexia bacterium]
MIIGVLSDTHGTIHPRLLPTFREAGVQLILHAGDVGDPAVLETLSSIAEVVAVRGNVDNEGMSVGGTAELPEEIRKTWNGVDIYMTHIGDKPKVWIRALSNPKPQVAICGHSHVSLLEKLGGVLFLNPGSAGTRPRFGGTFSAALLTVENGKVAAELIDFGR